MSRIRLLLKRWSRIGFTADWHVTRSIKNLGGLLCGYVARNQRISHCRVVELETNYVIRQRQRWIVAHVRTGNYLCQQSGLVSFVSRLGIGSTGEIDSNLSNRINGIVYTPYGHRVCMVSWLSHSSQFIDSSSMLVTVPRVRYAHSTECAIFHDSHGAR